MPWFRQTAARPAAALFHLAPVAVQSYGRHAAWLSAAASEGCCSVSFSSWGMPAAWLRHKHRYCPAHAWYSTGAIPLSILLFAAPSFRKRGCSTPQSNILHLGCL